LNLKSNIESGSSHFSFKRVVPGGLNMGFIGSTCIALPSASTSGWQALMRTAQGRTLSTLLAST
jgi:hypothetical protein